MLLIKHLCSAAVGNNADLQSFQVAVKFIVCRILKAWCIVENIAHVFICPLILGLEDQKGTGRIGFWPFNGTVVPAHRAFISEATYRSKVGDANAKGAIFFFNDPETTGITHIQNSDATTKNDAWYSLDGRQLTGKPTQKGVYIHKGRKEVVR